MSGRTNASPIFDEPQPWMVEGLCKPDPSRDSPDPNTDPIRWNLWWYPLSKKQMPLEARATCEACPVLEQCDTYQKHRERGESLLFRFGNAAGKTPKERFDEAKARNAPKRLAVLGHG